MFGRKTHLSLARKRLADMDKALAMLKRRVRGRSAKADGKKLVAEMKKRRAQLQTVADQMKRHADQAEARMKKLGVASTLSWSAFSTAFIKSQKAFGRANSKARRAVRRAVR